MKVLGSNQKKSLYFWLFQYFRIESHLPEFPTTGPMKLWNRQSWVDYWTEKLIIYYGHVVKMMYKTLEQGLHSRAFQSMTVILSLSVTSLSPCLRGLVDPRTRCAYWLFWSLMAIIFTDFPMASILNFRFWNIDEYWTYWSHLKLRCEIRARHCPKVRYNKNSNEDMKMERKRNTFAFRLSRCIGSSTCCCYLRRH